MSHHEGPALLIAETACMLRPFYPLSLGSGPFWSALLPFWSPLLVSLPLHPRVSAPLLGFMFPRPPGVPPAVWLPLPAWGSLMLTACIGLTDTDCLPRTHWLPLPGSPPETHCLGLTAPRCGKGGPGPLGAYGGGSAPVAGGGSGHRAGAGAMAGGGRARAGLDAACVRDGGRPVRHVGGRHPGRAAGRVHGDEEVAQGAGPAGPARRLRVGCIGINAGTDAALAASLVRGCFALRMVSALTQAVRGGGVALSWRAARWPRCRRPAGVDGHILQASPHGPLPARTPEPSNLRAHIRRRQQGKPCITLQLERRWTAAGTSRVFALSPARAGRSIADACSPRLDS